MLPELRPDILLEAYAQGMFPMADEDGEILWFSPDPRAILPLDDFHVSRNLRRRYESGRFTITVDQAFDKVITCCADREDGTWISADMIKAYTRLHELHHVHSVETWLEGELAGGLYGVTLGGAFFGESMFHRRTDASKVAMLFLVERMAERGFSLLDTQFMTDHLARFGAVEISRSQYLEQLDFALSRNCVFAD